VLFSWYIYMNHWDRSCHSDLFKKSTTRILPSFFRDHYFQALYRLKITCFSRMFYGFPLCFMSSCPWVAFISSHAGNKAAWSTPWIFTVGNRGGKCLAKANGLCRFILFRFKVRCRCEYFIAVF